ncbi:hypothetical protein BASA81_003307 [Batrachochytrium salamandrivorans]|nr:hypothetical protein BASA81_003307 [Batrachochytrium salamandrivorans]
MEHALVVVLSCPNLPVQFLRMEQRGVTTEKQEPVLHALDLLLNNVQRTIPFLVAERDARRAQLVFSWLLGQDSASEQVFGGIALLLESKHRLKTLRFLQIAKLPAKCELIMLELLTNKLLKQPGLELTTSTLLARDFAHFLIWKHHKLVGEVEEVLVSGFVCALEREVAWVENNLLLSLTLNQVLQQTVHSRVLPETGLLSLIGKRSDADSGGEEEEENKRWDAITKHLSNVDAPKHVVYDNLLEACLLLGRSKTRLQSMLPFAIKCLGSPGLDQQTHLLASALLRSVSVSQENASGIQAALFPLLDEQDGISTAAIELLAESTLRDPSSMLRELQVRLKQTDKPRSSSLQVLTKVLEGRGTDLASQSWDEKLFDLLLKQLSDEQLGHRQLASKQVAQVLLSGGGRWQSLGFPKLCALLTSRQDKHTTSAAAAEALVLVMSHVDELGSGPLLELLMLKVAPPEQELAFDLTGRWLALRKQQPFQVEVVLECCCRNAQTMPQLFGLARRIGLGLYQSRSTELLVRWITNLVPKLPIAQENVLDRLAPFLLLKVFPAVPIDLLEDSELLPLQQQLCLVFSARDEFPQVRRMAVELLAHLRTTSLPWQLFLTVLDGRGEEKDMDVMIGKLNAIVPGGFVQGLDANSLTKSALFGLCQAVVGVILQREFGEDAFPGSVAGPVVLSRLKRDNHDPALLEGCCEYFCLAVCCEQFPQWEALGAAAATSKSSSLVAVEEISEDAAVNNPSLTSLEMVFDGLYEGSESEFACKTLCQVLRCFVSDKQSLAAASLNTCLPPARIQQAGWGLCKQLFTRLFSVERQVANRRHFYLLAFTGCFVNMKLFPNHSALLGHQLTWLVNASLEDLSSDAKIQVLRVIGILLTFPSDLLGQLPDGSLGRIQSKLMGIANVDPLPEARALAREILKSFESH